MIRHRHLNINSPSVDAPAADRAAPGEGAPLSSSSGAGEIESAHGARGFAAASAGAPETSGGVQSDARPLVGMVALPDPYGLYLSIIAAHDRCAREDFIQGAIRRRLDEIGIGRALDLAESADQTFLRGGEEASRLAHNQEIAGASPALATSDNPSAVTDRRGEKREGCSGDAARPASRDPP